MLSEVSFGNLHKGPKRRLVPHGFLPLPLRSKGGVEIHGSVLNDF